MFRRWKCEGISGVGDGHPRGPAVILSCKQEEGWLHFSSHKRGGKSPSIILFKSSSRRRGDTETGSNWTHYLPSMPVFTDPWTQFVLVAFSAGDLLRQEEHFDAEF